MKLTTTSITHMENSNSNSSLCLSHNGEDIEQFSNWEDRGEGILVFMGVGLVVLGSYLLLETKKQPRDSGD